MSRAYLAHHELESEFIIIIIINVQGASSAALSEAYKGADPGAIAAAGSQR